MELVRQCEDQAREEQRRIHLAAWAKAAGGRDTRTLTLRILCIDGGGIRGLIPSVVIQELEKLCDGRPVRELFDLVCGTSTGGIIALGTCVGNTSIDQMIDIYKNRADKIWTEKSYAARLVGGVSSVTSGKYDATGLEEILQQHSATPDGTGQIMLNTELQAWPRVFVPTVKLAQEGDRGGSEGEVELLKSYEQPSVGDCELWKAGRATGAAPRYLDPIEIGGHKFVDGGMKANNPTWLALEEARRLFPDRRIGCIVSLGCGLDQQSRAAGDGVKALAGVMTDPEQTHRDICTKVMGATAQQPSSDGRVSQLGRQTHLGCGREGKGLLSDAVDKDALYVRINPVLNFKWANDRVKMDTKDAADLESMEKAARSHIHDPQVKQLLRKVKDKLCEVDPAAEVDGTPLVEPEPEPQPEEASGVAVDWQSEVAKIVDELSEVTAEQAWEALDAAAAATAPRGGGAAAASLRAAARR